MPVRPGIVSLRIQDSLTRTSGADFSGATGLPVLYVRTPNRTNFTVVGSWVGAQADGVAQAFLTSRIDQPGGWRGQFHIPGIGNGAPFDISVSGNLPNVPAP